MPTYQNTSPNVISEKGVIFSPAETKSTYQILTDPNLTLTSNQPYGEVNSRDRISISVAIGATSDPLYIHDRAANFTVAVDCPGGTLEVESTISSRDLVEAGTAIWHSWSLGATTKGLQNLPGPITAVRGKCLVAVGTLEVGVGALYE